MNGKRARKLRQEVEKFANPIEIGYLRHTKTGVIVLDPKCSRSIYQRTKKIYKTYKGMK